MCCFARRQALYWVETGIDVSKAVFLWDGGVVRLTEMMVPVGVDLCSIILGVSLDSVLRVEVMCHKLI